jgi:hypothetical protein
MSLENGNGNGAPSAKLIEKIKKMLALANDKRGNEAEASVAAAKAAELMEEYGLTVMAVESSGGVAEGREREAFRNDLRWHFYEPLMRAVAESCFCYLDVERLTAHKRFEFTLIGRQSAVVSAKVLYEYLKTTIHRLGREAKSGGAVELLFCAGASERIVERLHDRHVNRLREQKQEVERKQREAASRAQHPGAAPSTSTALVVTLEDYEQRERELNEDHRRGRPPGTTAKERQEQQAKAAAKDALYQKLMAEGVPDGIAFNIAQLGMSRERAESYEKEWLKANAKAQAKARRRGWTKSDQAGWERSQARADREARRKSSSSWTSGRDAGENVGLDQQVEKKETKKLS